MKMNAPIKIEMKVYAIEEESGQQAVVTCRFLWANTLLEQH